MRNGRERENGAMPANSAHSKPSVSQIPLEEGGRGGGREGREKGREEKMQKPVSLSNQHILLHIILKASKYPVIGKNFDYNNYSSSL